MALLATDILYNGVCPVCRAGACDLERRAIAAAAGVTFTDVAAHPDRLAALGLTLDAVRLKMHAVDETGRIRAGMPAIAMAWAATPPYRPLGRLMQVWPLTWLGAALYHCAAHILYAWNRARRRW